MLGPRKHYRRIRHPRATTPCAGCHYNNSTVPWICICSRPPTKVMTWNLARLYTCDGWALRKEQNG